MENRHLTVEELERLVRPRKRLLHQEWLGNWIEEPVDHTPDSIKEPVIVRAEKKPIWWLSDFISD